jgi:hypothetical protein
MYTLKLVTTKEDLISWEMLVDNAKKDQIITIAHNPCLINILSDTFGYKPESYLIIESEKVIGILPGVRIGTKYVSIPHFSYGGPICLNEDFMKSSLNELFPKQNYDIRSFNLLSEFCNDEKVICYLRLQDTVEKQWEGFKSKLRSQIKKGYSYELETINGGLELLSDFYKVYTQNMLRLGSPPLPKKLFSNILNSYKCGIVNIVVVRINDLAVAAGMTLSYMGFKEICWASSDYRYNKYNVNMVLYWEIIKNSIIEGDKIFSFGRSSKNSNTYKFKLQWEPIVVPLFFNYSFQHKFNIKKLTLLSDIWKKQPRFSSIFFGKIISKYLY